MKKINFTNATVTAQASVEIDGVSHDVTPAVIEGGTLPTPDNINQLQTNIEECFNGETPMGKIRVEDIECKNLFNKYGSLTDYISYSSGSITLENDKIKATANISNGNGKGQIIQLKPNTIYTFSAKVDSVEVSGQTSFRILEVNNDGTATNRILDTAQTVTAGETYSYQFTTGSTGKIWLTLNGISNNDYTVFKYVIYDNIQIEKGSTATSYTPYKKFGYNSQESMGSIVVDDIRCKNLFNINKPESYERAALSINGNSFTITKLSGTAYEPGYVSFLVNVKPNTNYTLSGIMSGVEQYDQISIWNKDISSSIKADQKTLPFTFNSGNNSVISVLFYSDNASSPNTFTNIQIDEGDTATNYSEYKGIGYTSGSNANGSWVKYDDGRMECYKKEINIPANQEYYTVNFPMKFANNDITIIATTKYAYYKGASIDLADVNEENFNAFPTTPNGSIPSLITCFSYIAYGYWK